MEFEIQLDLLREANHWLDSKLFRCFDVYRLNYLLKMHIQNLQRIQSNTEQMVKELEEI